MDVFTWQKYSWKETGTCRLSDIVCITTHNIASSGPRGQGLRTLFLNHSIISPLCLVWVRAPLSPYVRQAKFCLRVCQVVFSRFFFLNSVLRPFQDYFSSYETSQSVGGAKTGKPRKKPPDTPASRTWLISHVARAGLEPTPVTAVR